MLLKAELPNKQQQQKTKNKKGAIEMDKTPIKLKLDGIDAPQKRVRIKNAPVSEVFSLCELVQYQEGQVVSRTLA